MTRLRLHEIHLLSEVEKTAKRVKFPSLVTVIKGENDHGKSCLIKSLYAAFGAIPQKVHPNWEKLNVALLVHFEIAGTHFHILKAGKLFSLFNSEEELIQSYSSVTKGLGPALSELFDFNLKLTNSSTRQAEQATPAFLFLPFYFDQDRSWIESWSSFERLQQFRSYRKAIAEYHTGLRPNEYYAAKGRQAEAFDDREELRNQRVVVNRVLEKIETLMKESQFDLDIANYEQEVARLLSQCNVLRTKEEALRDQMVSIDNKRIFIERQIEITVQAANELNKDFVFAAEKLGDNVECPTCGAHYENSFAERFGIAADEDHFRALLVKLNEELTQCDLELEIKREAASSIAKCVTEIQDLLAVRQGEIRLQDVLQSEGKKEVRHVLRSEVDELNREIGEADERIQKAEGEMRKLIAPKRTKEIKEYYQGRMSVYLRLLNVTELSESSYENVHSQIKENGSDGPRALLAFYFAILKSIEKYSTTTICPIVIDSPNQQDQDVDNWRRILEFMRDQRPPEAQMILGLVDDLGIDMGGEVVELTHYRQLLQKDEYHDVATRVRPFLDKVLS
ncbi:MAG: hypothetical protein WDZ51_07620 [Pirellulaceae bacterium]